MKKRTLTVIIAVIVVLVLAFSIYKYTGGSVIMGLPGKCTDTDDGLNYFVKGTASQENRNKIYTDYCVSGEVKRLNEYYCSTLTAIDSKRIFCDVACIDGACVNATQ